MTNRLDEPIDQHQITDWTYGHGVVRTSFHGAPIPKYRNTIVQLIGRSTSGSEVKVLEQERAAGPAITFRCSRAAQFSLPPGGVGLDPDGHERTTNPRSRSNEDMRNDHCKPYGTPQFVGWKISLPLKLNATWADIALAL